MAIRMYWCTFQVIFGFALSRYVHPWCDCSISAVIHVRHLTKLPVCTFSNYVAFYFKLASFWHLITRPTLHFRMGNWSQVFSWSQWGRFILHFTYNFWPFFCSQVQFLICTFSLLMYSFLISKTCCWLVCILSICVYLRNYIFHWRQSWLLIFQTPCHLAAVTIIPNPDATLMSDDGVMLFTNMADFYIHFLVGLWNPGWCSVMNDSWSVQSNCCLLSDMLFLVLYFELARIRIMRMNINSLENHRISTIQLANRSVTSFGSFQQQTQKYVAVHLTPDITVDA